MKVLKKTNNDAQGTEGTQLLRQLLSNAKPSLMET